MPGNETLRERCEALIEKWEKMGDGYQNSSLASGDELAGGIGVAYSACRDELFEAVRSGTPAAPPCDNPDHPDPALKSYYQEGDTTATPCDGSGTRTHCMCEAQSCRHPEICDEPCPGCPACAASEEAR